MSTSRFRCIFDEYKTIFNDPAARFLNPNAQMQLPTVSKDFLSDLITEATYIFKGESTLIDVPLPLVVIGDLHGHLIDLLQILKTYQDPLTYNFLFLGDLVDRGEFSTEVLTLVLTMKVLWPKNVFIIRGNHEFSEIYEENGFSDELFKIYKDRLFIEKFDECFSYMPLAATGGRMLFLHGGIGPSIGSMFEILVISKPVKSFASEAITEILWSDPNPNPNFPYFSTSSRGSGYLFGSAVVSQFLKQNDLDCIVRGHQMMKNGIERLFNGKVITVFSASNYCGYNSNKSGVLEVSFTGKSRDVIFNQGRYVSRKAVFFYDFDEPENAPASPTKERPRPKEISTIPRYNSLQKVPQTVSSPKSPTSPQVFGKSMSNHVLTRGRRLPSVPKPMSLPTRSSSPFKPKVRSSSVANHQSSTKKELSPKPTRLRRGSFKL